MIYEFTFENPNSLNNHFKTNTKTGVTYITAKGKEFRKHVIDVVTKAGCHNLKLKGRISYKAIYYPPNKMRRDIDNFCTKGIFDALTHAGLYEDDTQIDQVQYSRGKVQIDRIGKLKVWIEEIDEHLED